MVDPINYGALMPQLDLSPLTRGLQQRQANQFQSAQLQEQKDRTQLAQRQFELKAQDQQAYLAAVEAYRENPSPAALRDLGIRFPDHQKELQDAGDSYTASQKQDLIGAGFSALGAISAGNVPLAIDTLTKRRDAFKNSGIDTSHTDSAIQMLKDGKIKEATAYLSYAMGGLVGTDHAAGVLETLGVGGKADDRRADNARADKALTIQQQRADTADRRAASADARAEHREARADAREARIAAGGASASSGYEYRVNPATGKIQKRKKP